MVIQHIDPAARVEPGGAPARSSQAALAMLGGLLAGGVTVGIAEFFAGVVLRLGWSTGTPSPVLAVGGAFIDRTPPWLKTFAVDNFGTNDKHVLLAGIAVVLALLSPSARGRRSGVARHAKPGGRSTDGSPRCEQ